MKFEKAVAWSHRMISEAVGEGSCVIDATAGNGHDTLFLSTLVGSTGHVIALDIQSEAIESTEQRLKSAGIERERYTLVQSDHSELEHCVPPEWKAKVSGIMFNFGYLPGGDHNLTTNRDSSRKAVMVASEYLGLGGRMTLTFYTGHPGGPEEAQEVISMVESFDPKKFVVLMYQFINLPNCPPYVVTIERVDRY